MLSFSRPPYGPLRARPVAFKEFPTTYFWTWIAMDLFFGGTPLEGWEEIDSIDDDSFIILCSQLSQVAEGRNAQGPTGRYFVKTEDLQFATQYPVLLAHQAPATVPPQKPEEMLIGTHGVILEGDTIRLCPLEHLGDAGEEIWTRLKQGTTLIPLRGTVKGHERTLQERSHANEVKNELWERAKLAARQLAILYYRLHEEMEKNALTSSPRVLPETHSVMRGKGIIIPQLDPIEGVLHALSNAQREQGGWEEIDHIPTYTHQRPTSTTEISVRPPGIQVVTPDITGQLWQQVRQFSDLDGDIFLAMLAQLVGTPHDPRGGTWITAQQVLEYRGIQPKIHKKENHKPGESIHRRAGHRYEDLKEIAEGVTRIRDMHITVRTWRENHKRRKTNKQARRRIFEQQSYLITVSDYIQQSQLLQEEEQIPDAPLAVAWYYQPGTCLESFLIGPNYRAAWLLQQALHYDPYHEKWEKRLARYFTFQMRMNADFGGTTIKRTIGTLIDELALPVNRTDPDKTKKRFEKAMNQLRQDGIISSWGPEERYYQDMEQYPRRNWLESWLAHEIEVSAASLQWERTQEIMEHLQIQRRQRRALQLASERVPKEKPEAYANSHESSNTSERELALLLEDSCKFFYMNLLTELRK